MHFVIVWIISHLAYFTASIRKWYLNMFGSKWKAGYGEWNAVVTSWISESRKTFCSEHSCRCLTVGFSHTQMEGGEEGVFLKVEGTSLLDQVVLKLLEKILTQTMVQTVSPSLSLFSIFPRYYPQQHLTLSEAVSLSSIDYRLHITRLISEFNAPCTSYVDQTIQPTVLSML